MTSRYDNNDGRYGDSGRSARRQGRGAYGQEPSARQRFSQSYEEHGQQASQQTGVHGRLHHDEAIRDHGQASRSRQHQVADYDRERYASRSRGGVQGLRTQDQLRQQEQARRQATIQGAQQNASRQGQGARRAVQLDQTGQIPRYDVPGQTGSWHRQGQQHAAQGRYPQQGNVASRYGRSSGMYQARPDAATNVVNAASGAQGGFLSSPISYVVRVAIIVVLLLVFGVRGVLNGGTASQLADVNASIASQQEQLDSLNSQNEQLQSSIDGRQETLDAYSKLVQASS